MRRLDRMQQIILNGMRLEFGAFVMAIQRWQVQLSLLDLENFLASQEAFVKQLDGMTMEKKGDETALYGGRHEASSLSQHRRQSLVEKTGNAIHDCYRCMCLEGVLRSQKDNGADIGEFYRRSVVCYNCGRERHYVRECRLKKQEENVVVAMKEKTPINLKSEEEWGAFTTIAIAGERVWESEEEIDFKAWFFEEAVEKETTFRSCVVTVKKKPQ